MVKKSPLVCMLSHFNCIQLFATLGTIAHQAPLSMGFSRLRILEWGYHAFLQGIFPTQGSNLCVLNLLHWQAGFLPLPPPGQPEKSPQLTVKKPHCSQIFQNTTCLQPSLLIPMRLMANSPIYYLPHETSGPSPFL